MLVVTGTDAGIADVHIFKLTWLVRSSAGHKRGKNLSLGLGQTAWFWRWTLDACLLLLTAYIHILGGLVYHSCGRCC